MNRHASMNRIFRLVWNESLNAYVPAAETARGRGKSSKRKLIAAALSLSVLSLATGIAQAGPTGGQVTGGSGTITQSGSTTTVQQSSQNLSLNWATFNIAPQETVDFVQPNATSIAVNRILDPNGSTIFGHLNANGQVYLINPNGVVFGKGAEVNVGGLVASALNLNDNTFGSDSKTFSGTGSGSVVNEGTITAVTGGSIALLGNHVTNNGVISAELGTVALGAGSAATLTFHGTNLVSMQIDRSVLNSVASNGGLIQADGGHVLMTAGAQKALLASVVNNTGIIEARTLENHGGTITLLGGMSAGSVNIDGTLDASAPTSGDGGFIETSAARVRIGDSAKVTTAAALGLNGTWLIDPTDFTIAASGGDETGAQLSSALNSGNVQIQSSNGASGTSGNINVDDTVAWTANTLTLNAQNDININSAMNGSGAASLALRYGQGAVNAGNSSTYNVNAPVNLAAGPHFSTQLGSDGSVTQFTVVDSLGVAADASGGSNQTLQGIARSGNASGNFVLGANIDASPTSGWNSGAGFTAIGNFAGIFDGLGHSIANLSIDTPSNLNVGLFGTVANSGIVRNIGLDGGSVTGLSDVGSLAGSNLGQIDNSYSSVAVTAGHLSGPGGVSYAGGLVGFNYAGTIDNSYATGNVQSTGAKVGGLVGVAHYGTSINNSYATGTVSGTTEVGGLIGDSGGTINNSYATGSVTSAALSQGTGGLAGINYGTITNSHATGAVTGADYVGGLVGDSSGTVTNSYATGTVHGSNYVGGLTGKNGSQISNSYATGNTTGTNDVGGLAGGNYGSISGSHATGTVGGSSYVGGVAGLSSGQLSTSYATGNVTGTDDVGGLVGASFGGAISGSNATGTVSGSNYVGGLVGSNGGPVSDSYATGSVHGSNYVGGLAGSNSGAVSNSYATGNISGHNEVGGLVGGSYGSGVISASHATGSVSGSDYVGGLVGSNYGTTVSGKSYATGTVTGLISVGGLVGGNLNYGSNVATVTQSYATTGTVTGTNGVGGLVGNNNGSVSGSYATRSVTGTTNSGGLVGLNNGSITTSYATGAVTGGNYSGGLVGQNDALGTVSSSFATGSVSGGRYTGGFAGTNYGSISNSYAAGSVTGTLNVGGLAGINGTGTGSISNSYATGSVSGASYVGGLVGAQLGAVTNSFYSSSANPALTGFGAGSGGTPDVAGTVMGMTTAQLQTQANFTSATAANGNVNPGWDFANTWFMYEGETAPLLRVFMTPLTVSSTLTQTYDGTVFAPTISSLTYSSTPDFSHIFGTVTLTGSAFGAVNVGSYSYMPTGLYSDQLGYLFTFQTSTLTITPATLTVAGTTAGKVYNGTTAAPLTGGTLVGLFGTDAVTLTQSGTFASKNAGSGIAVTVSDSISGASAGDYIFVDPTGVTGTITPAPLTVSGTTVGNKVYDGTAVAPLGGGYLVGVVSGDTVTLGQSGTFASANVGTGIAVTATDILGGASAGDYSIVEPTGLIGSILPVPGTSGASGASSSLLLAAENARTQIVENFIYPQLGANPQVINPSPTIAAFASSVDDANAGPPGLQQAVAVNVSMKIGANGTLKIENGGLRLPSNLVVGNE